MADWTETHERRTFAVETKFVVERALGEIIRQWARAHLSADPYGSGAHGDQYRTASIYFDTPEFDVFYRRGSSGRSKFRIRRYDAASEVFLERKLTRPGVVTKRRTRVPIASLGQLDPAHADRVWPGQWFERRVRLRGLRPVCQVFYMRTARVGPSSRGQVRLTIDEALSAAPARGAEFVLSADEDAMPVAEADLILELKYSVEMPLMFKDVVERFGLTPRAASKYRLSVAALGYAPGSGIT